MNSGLAGRHCVAFFEHFPEHALSRCLPCRLFESANISSELLNARRRQMIDDSTVSKCGMVDRERQRMIDGSEDTKLVLGGLHCSPMILSGTERVHDESIQCLKSVTSRGSRRGMLRSQRLEAARPAVHRNAVQTSLRQHCFYPALSTSRTVRAGAERLS